MTTTRNDNNVNNYEVPLELSERLKSEGIIQKFIIHKRDKSVKLRLNSKYDPPINIDVPIDIIKRKNDGWIKFTDKFRKDLKDFGVDEDHNLQIYSTLNYNSDLIRGIDDYGDLSDPRDISNNSNNENIEKNELKHQEQDQELPIDQIISVSQAIRKNSGIVKVNGTIIGITKLFNMISKVSLYCDSCESTTESDFDSFPLFDTLFLRKNCEVCKNLIKNNNVNPIEFKNTVNIELQDTKNFDDLDQLTVFLFDRDTDGIKVGENVEIIGDIKILNYNKRRYFTYLFADSIKYLNKEDNILTESDIKIIKRFEDIHKDRVIDKLVSMFDPSIVEHDDAKKGILMSAVNTSEKIGDDSEHIDILFIGPPGTAKSKILGKATELVPGSNKAGGQYSSGKSLTAIIDKTDDNTFLRLGLIPRSRGAFCAINELGRQHPEDQDKLLDVMQERWFPFDKYGIHADIMSPTTILASANPINKDRWINNDKIDFNEFPFLEPIKDRFDLIFAFQYKKTQKERNEFADKLSETEAKKKRKELPDYTPFLIKYIQYAKQFNPVLSDEARIMLTEFYKRISNNGFGSPRILFTLFKLAISIARLKLKNVVDEYDATETMEFYNDILLKFQKNAIISKSPKYLAYEKGVKILERFKRHGGVTVEELFKIICQEDEQLANYFGYGKRQLKIKYNSKIRDVYELLIKHTNVKKVGEKPIILQWLVVSDSSDPCDKSKTSIEEKNVEKIEKHDEMNIESVSHISHRSLSEEGNEGNEENEDENEVVNEYAMKLGTNYKLPMHKISEEQYNSLNGRSNEEKTN